MSQKDYKNRHILLTVWSWSVQIIAQISFLFLALHLYYQKIFDNIDKKYFNYYDHNNIPLYCSDWSTNIFPFQPPLITFIISYILYLITEFCSSTFRYLWNKKKEDSLYKKMNELFTGRPTITFKIECYHEEQEIRYYTDKNGYRQMERTTRRK